ncbi:MAG TPA: hypothetical protein VMT03_18470 [Polyangia bacterium]|nr:hypothetical protein [Polyangia bacterium]
MSRGPTDLPERLLAGDATDFERRVLGAARDKGPSAAASARMARALGVTATSIGVATAAKTLAAGATATKATAAAATSTVWTTWPWVSAAVFGLAVAGAVVGVRSWRTPSSQPARISAPQPAPEQPAPLQPAPGEPLPAAAAMPAERTSVGVAPRRHGHPAVAEGDLRDQIALVDSARQALTTGSPERSLELLRRYQDRYPSGSFRPEASALAIEALMKAGREAEARAQATRFIGEHRGSLLANRVSELVGLSDRPAPR